MLASGWPEVKRSRRRETSKQPSPGRTEAGDRHRSGLGAPRSKHPCPPKRPGAPISESATPCMVKEWSADLRIGYALHGQAPHGGVPLRRKGFGRRVGQCRFDKPQHGEAVSRTRRSGWTWRSRVENTALRLDMAKPCREHGAPVGHGEAHHGGVPLRRKGFGCRVGLWGGLKEAGSARWRGNSATENVPSGWVSGAPSGRRGDPELG